MKAMSNEAVVVGEKIGAVGVYHRKIIEGGGIDAKRVGNAGVALDSGDRCGFPSHVHCVDAKSGSEVDHAASRRNHRGVPSGDTVGCGLLAG